MGSVDAALIMATGLPRTGPTCSNSRRFSPSSTSSVGFLSRGQLQDYCVEHNIGVLPYYGLASGFLTGKYRTAEDMQRSPRGGMAELIAEKSGVLAAMDAVAAETGATLAQIALAWLAAQPGVVAPIASATSVKQVEDLLGATRLTLSTEQLERLTNAGV